LVRTNGARLGIDLVDLAIAVLPHPQAALGPGEARVAAVAGAGIDATTSPVAGSILSMRASAIW